MQHLKLTDEGQKLHNQGHLLMQEIAFLTGATDPLQGAPQDELMFGARFYQCLHCGTRYESLPSCQGAVKCRQCGSNLVKEE